MADLVDNLPLRTAVEAFAAESNQQTYWEVLRNTLQGDLLYDITGSTPPVDGVLQKGAVLRFHEGTGPDGGRALFAFTRQEEAQKMHPDEPASTLGQSAPSALDFAKSQGYAWLYIDPAGPTCGLEMKDVDFTLRGERNDAVKAALATVGSPDEVRRAVIDAMSLGGSLLLGVNERPDGTVQVRTSTGPNDVPVSLAFTSAVEVVVRNPGDAWSAVPIARIVADAITEPFQGLVLNPAGPWLGLYPDELREIQSRLPA